MEPILGFRAWRISPGPRVGAKAAAAPDWAGPYKALPELEAWNKTRRLAAAGRETKPSWRPERGVLMPLVMGKKTTWSKPGAVSFACSAGHTRPDAACQCGLYAWFTLADLATGRAGEVFGAVVAWGHIILHGAEGFRAEHVRIVALSPKSQQSPLPRVAAERLGVPLVPLNRLEEVGREFGVPVSIEYRFGD